MNKRTRKSLVSVAVAVTAFAVLIIELYPIGITILNGFRRDIVILSGQPFKLSQLTLRSYQMVLKNVGFILGMKNSIIIGLLSTGISVFIGALASYGIARFHFRWRNGLAYSFLVFRMPVSYTHLTLPTIYSV